MSVGGRLEVLLSASPSKLDRKHDDKTIETAVGFLWEKLPGKTKQLRYVSCENTNRHKHKECLLKFKKKRTQLRQENKTRNKQLIFSELNKSKFPHRLMLRN